MPGSLALSAPAAARAAPTPGPGRTLLAAASCRSDRSLAPRAAPPRGINPRGFTGPGWEGGRGPGGAAVLTAPPPDGLGGDRDSGRLRLGLTGVGIGTRAAAAGPGEGQGAGGRILGCTLLLGERALGSAGRMKRLPETASSSQLFVTARAGQLVLFVIQLSAQPYLQSNYRGIHLCCCPSSGSDHTKHLCAAHWLLWYCSPLPHHRRPAATAFIFNS